MKFLSAVALSALGFSLNVAGQLSVVEGVITTIEGKVNALDTAVKAYNGGSDVSALQAAAAAIVTATNAGIATVKGSADLSENDALGLTTPVQTLTTDVQTSISDLIAKKPQVEAACQGANVLAALNAQNTASSALAAAITSKVPASLQGVASQLSSGITAAIQKGIAAFQDSTCSSSTAPSKSATKSASSPGTSSTPTSTEVAPSKSGSSGPTGTAPSSTPSTPVFTGAASMNSFNAPVGVVAALAAVLAL